MPWETLEPLVHVMGSLYNEEKTKAVLLVDAKNAFNVVNRKAFYIICPFVATFVYNRYSKPRRLYVIGRVEISLSKGTTLRDLIAVAVYAIAIIPLILILK